MSRGFFNSTCTRCNQFRPRCAVCIIRGAPDFAGDSENKECTHYQETLCEACRKAAKGTFMLHPQHKGKKA